MAQRGGQDPSPEQGSSNGSRVPDANASGRRVLVDAAITTDAFNWARCHELRINDKNSTWRIVYRVDEDAILILDVFQKKTSATPKSVVGICKQRMKQYDTDS